jgi:SMI1 / KNR4 family (SUKH-1)
MADEQLSPELIEQIRTRANDPERRSDASSLGAHTMSLDDVFDRLGPKGAQLRSIKDQLQGIMGSFGNIRVAGPMPGQEQPQGRSPEPLAPPATPDQLAECEEATGRSLPQAVRQLYSEVADGGFGPGDGLFPLERIADEYREMTDEPAGPQNQLWPANLLPLVDGEPGYDCLDMDSGAMVGWDPQEIEGYSNAAWLRSFRPLAPSLAAWLQEWLDRPTAGERLAATRAEAQPGNDGRIKFLLDYYSKNPDKRAERGLPEVGVAALVTRRPCCEAGL